jgi:hypothetical protein
MQIVHEMTSRGVADHAFSVFFSHANAVQVGVRAVSAAL